MIRQNVIEILNHLGESYAYDIYRHYSVIFPKVTMRSIYYHLNKGITTKEFIVKRISSEKGDYSWGPTAEKIYYSLGPAASPRSLPVVSEYFNKKQ
jgi:Fe2+ or Zn2+ uptake regulation protein